MGLTPQSPRSGTAALLFSGLHLLAVWNFAVAQPLFDLFSRTAEFFVLRQSPPLDIILFVVLLSVGLPALGVLVVWGVRAVHAGLSTCLHLLLLGCLSALLALQALLAFQGLPYISGMVLFLGAGGSGLLMSVIYHLPLSSADILHAALAWNCALSDPFSLFLSGLNAAVLVAR